VAEGSRDDKQEGLLYRLIKGNRFSSLADLRRYVESSGMLKQAAGGQK